MNISNFFKTNWFLIALISLVCVAFVKDRRKNSSGSIKLKNGFELKKNNPERFTDAGGTTASPTTMGFGNDSETHANLPEISDEEAMTFFKRFRKVAEEEERKFGIPASVILACAYINSYAGQRDFVKTAHNYFALTCSKSWEGKSFSQNGKCYREYETAWESYRDFTKTVTQQGWYADFKSSDKTKPAAWISNLVESGVSDVDDFENHALNVIERYHLFELDKK
jgi:flagellum-specific peptidoglycan hydrolase FlgJ